jgi:hypothetical protein
LRSRAISVTNRHLASLPLTRSSWIARPLPVALVLVLCSALLLAAAAPASAVTRKQATKKALAVLGPKAGERVVVYRLPKPLKAGTVITARGKRVAKVGRERAYFFYRDAAAGQPYPHAGRVALVGAKKGKVRLSAGIMWQPLVNGRLPAFLRGSTLNGASDYVVFDSTSSASGSDPASSPLAAPLAPNDPFAADGGPNSPPKADPQVVRAKAGSPKRITLTGSDDDGDLITFHITHQPRNGTLTGQPPDLTYTPNPGFLGNDNFSFKVSDGDAESNAAVVSIDVVPPGLPPVVATSSGCTSYTEQSPAVVIDGQLTVTDLDDLTLDSARVRVDYSDLPPADPEDPNTTRLGDELLFTDQNGITGSYEERTGILDLVGTATVANYQAALRSVRYRNLSNPNPPPTRNVIFTVNDAGNNSTPATKQVCITGGAAGNDPPTGENGEGSLSYVENDGPIPVDGGFVVGDPDSTTLSGAYVKFVPLVSQPVDENGDPVGPPTTTVTFDPAQDDLVFANQNGITGNYNDSTGVMTLSGTASLADYETAIRSVAYENVSEDPTADTRRVEFRLTDSSGSNSVPTRRDVFVTPVNDAPVATASAGTTDYTGADTVIDSALTAGDVDDTHLEGAQVRIASGLEAGDELVFADTAQITGIYDAEAGILTLSGSAPEADYQAALRSVAFDHTGVTPTGDRSIEFTVNDGELDSAPTAKHLEINEPPVLDATDTALAYTENDGPVAVDSGISATDVDSPTLSGATVSIGAGFSSGEDQLAFTDTAAIDGDYSASTGVLTLTGTASVADYQAALRSVTYENSSENPSTASRTVSFQADDGAVFNNLSNTVTRDVAVTAVNDAPGVDASDGSTAYTEGDPATAIDSALTVSDVDDTNLDSAQVSVSSGFQAGDDLVFAAQNGISGVYDSDTGVLTLSGSASVANYEAALRSVEYRHTGDDPDAAKTVEFSVSDGALSGSDSKALAVTGVNDKPVLDASDDALAYTEGDGAVAVDSGITAADADSDTLSGATVEISAGFAEGEDALAFADTAEIDGDYNASTGVLTLTGTASVADYQAALGSVTYENSSDAPTTDARTVTFQADDGSTTDNLSDPVTRDVAVTASNDAPVVTTSSGSTAYTEGDSATAIDSALTVSDVDDENIESATVTVASGADSGDVLSFEDTAAITGQYTPETGVLSLTGSASVADYEAALRSVQYSNSGDDPAASKSVAFTVNDGDADSAAASKGIDVTPANDAPAVTASDGNTAFENGGPAVAVDSALTVTDADDANIDGAVVQISSGFESGDTLTFADQNGITGAVTAPGELTLSGSASVADYEAALRSITYGNAGTVTEASKAVTFTVNDGDVDSSPASKSIDVSGIA